MWKLKNHKKQKNYFKGVNMYENDAEFLLHNDCVSLFKERLYSNIFTGETISTKKKSQLIGDEKFYGYFLEKGKEVFFAPDAFIKSMPFRVLKSTEMDFRTDVFTFIQDIEPITIPSEYKMSFRELIDKLPAFQHSQPLHFLLYKILIAASFVDRVNYRVSTGAGFGKDSVINIIADLVDSTANIYGATFAKMEFSLTNNFIVFNEMGNLKKDDKYNMQEFLLQSGAYFNTYTKRTRKTSTTQEQYSISNLSLTIAYNLPQYYISRGQEYFDQMFTPAVTDRFIPFVFEGRLTTPFEKLIDVKGIVTRNDDVYKDIVATLNYYKEHNVEKIKYNVNTDIIHFELDKTNKLERYSRSFNILLKYVSEYSKDDEEFQILSLELFKCYKSYLNLLVDEKKEGGIK